MRDYLPDDPGFLVLVAATGATCAVITVTSGVWAPWLFCGAGVVVGLWAARIVNK